MTTIRHMTIDIRGVLGWKDKKMTTNLFRVNGKKPTYEQVKEYLYDKLAEGYEVLPFSKECEGFDKVKGCPGHPQIDTP